MGSVFFKGEYKKGGYKVLFIFLLFFAFLVRAYLTRFGNFGDVAVFAEWGKRFWQLGIDKFYLDRNWYYSIPTYPPLSSLMFAALYWLYEKRYILAEIHNILKIFPPSAFIIYFNNQVKHDPFLYGYGYYLLLKLPAILGDLGLSILIYKMISKISKDIRKAFLGLIIYLFNPLTIFLSSVWGQTDSMVIFFGFLSFYLLLQRNVLFSLIAIFISFYLKPNFIVLFPLYTFLIFRERLFKNINFFKGILIAFLFFLITTIPFSEDNFSNFLKKILVENILPSAKGDLKASVSAFNIYSLFFRLDYTPSSFEIIGISLEAWGMIFYLIINLLAIIPLLSKRQDQDFNKTIISSSFLIGSGSFLFLTNMLERYFFPAFPFLIILILVDKRIRTKLAIFNFLLFLNLIWAFYRRSVGIIDHFFTDYNLLLIRIISLVNLYLWFSIFKEFFLSFDFRFLKRG